MAQVARATASRSGWRCRPSAATKAVAAWSGWQSRQRGEAVKVGYLLGSRRYEAHVAEFALGDTLQVRVEREFQADNGLARFRAQIHRGTELCAEASISVYEPPGS